MKEEYIIDSLTIRDFSSIGLLVSATRLGLSLHAVVDDRVSHLYSPAVFNWGSFKRERINLIEPGPQDMMGAVELGYRHTGLLLEDHAALHMAKQSGRMLITSDPAITKAALSLDITACNYIWLLLKIAKAKIITEEEAWRKHLELMQHISPIALSGVSPETIVKRTVNNRKTACSATSTTR